MIFEMKNCGGCRTCELACGYHHTGEFNIFNSCLRIVNRTDNEPGFLVNIEIFDKNRVTGCDGCKELVTPLCVSYCHQEDDLIAMIQTVLLEKENNK